MKIMLDAGHSRVTPGKRSPDGMLEFEFNSVVANYAKALLEEYLNTTVYFAHDPSGKVDIPLATRTDRANELNVDAYVSIHANAFGPGGWHDASGIETFIHPSKPKDAYELVIKIQTNLLRASGLPNRGVKTADFHVLRETDMTAVLPECGFMTNKGDLNKLKSDAYRRSVAQGIVYALADQYNLKKKPAPKLMEKKEAAAGEYPEKIQGLIEWVQENGISDGKNPYAPATLAYVWEVARNIVNKLEK
ncbi:N-acetylmuramoyl-L-alanine amidase [Mesobacillus subterraneus]|uniref:N-acetylmuramoyl-L-alanine amidase n=1 Tax=Mesobacillus subterraneus TaxID=285983 RepID=UPI00273FC9A9|nr:N-acetylmuramoyl-L-alanine amidase [Mesobacillus subterraneus]WLR53541.1 N-acetylmuramoyl-L-alanine amidase [Mesobacillus subterraneus]